METLKDYLKQGSTYRGISLIIGLIGVTVAPGAVEAIGAGIIAAIGIWETVRDQRNES